MHLLLVTLCATGVLLLPATAEVCEDLHINGCPVWSNAGYCKESSLYHRWMKENCKLSCKVCQAQKPNAAPTTAEVNVEACLKAHNEKRALHKDTQPLVWDDGLAAEAKAWAKHMMQIGKMKHSTSGEGENLYWSGGAATCTDAVKAWYDEIKDYPYNPPPKDISGGKGGEDIGHFTQLVWKGSKKLGVGMATKRNGNRVLETYIVARYSPPGNYNGQYGDQVAELKSSSA